MASLTFNIAKKRRLSVPVQAFEDDAELETEQPASEEETNQRAQLLQV